LVLHTAIARIEPEHLLEVQHCEAIELHRAEVAARALHPEHLRRAARERIGHLDLGRGVAAAEVGDARVGAEEIRAVQQQVFGAHRRGGARIPSAFEPRWSRRDPAFWCCTHQSTLTTGHSHAKLSLSIKIDQDQPNNYTRMLEAERHRVILKLIQERSVVSVADLVEILGTSEATVRRDVNALADNGQVRRIRGGAEALTPRHEAHLVGVPFEMSRAIAGPQKQAIARAAAELIKDGESIIINGGTTTFALVEYLAERDLDILTNSIPIVSKLLATSRNRVIIPGGTIYREQNIVLSPFENDTIEHFWGQKLLTGCYGLNRFGMMEADPLIV